MFAYNIKYAISAWTNKLQMEYKKGNGKVMPPNIKERKSLHLNYGLIYRIMKRLGYTSRLKQGCSFIKWRKLTKYVKSFIQLVPIRSDLSYTAPSKQHPGIETCEEPQSF